MVIKEFYQKYNRKSPFKKRMGLKKYCVIRSGCNTFYSEF
jgi:hypothetical protein